jgi:hypothetical protein
MNGIFKKWLKSVVLKKTNKNKVKRVFEKCILPLDKIYTAEYNVTK